MKKPVIAVVGGGPAGLMLARQLTRRQGLDANVMVFEQHPQVGGIATSFEDHELIYDYGSHRLHPATAPEIMEEINDLLGADLLRRPRNGRILLMGRFVKFPLNPVDLLRHLPPAFMFGTGRDAVQRMFRRSGASPKNFEEALLAGLGRTICRDFYFPYARKLWGLAPDEIAVEQAEKRVSAGTMGKMIKKVLSKVPGLGNRDAGVFFYPRKGFGQIANAMADAVEKEGGRVLRSMPVKQVLLSEGRIRAVVTPPEGPGMPDQEWGVDHVFSTIPITRLVSMLSPDVPDAVLEAAGNLRYRGMVFMYLELNTAQFTPYDAHYFPGKEVVFSRMSEPKNYYVGTTPKDRTGLCLEIPCAVGDDIWTASDEALGDRVMEDLAHVGLNVRPHVARMFSRRHANVYPMYDLDFAPRLQAVEDYLATVDGLVTLGRQGLFAHDNTHHTMEMACRASDCLADDLTWDQTAWAEHREVFRKHVVVD